MKRYIVPLSEEIPFWKFAFNIPHQKGALLRACPGCGKQKRMGPRFVIFWRTFADSDCCSKACVAVAILRWNARLLPPTPARATQAASGPEPSS